MAVAVGPQAAAWFSRVGAPDPLLVVKQRIFWVPKFLELCQYNQFSQRGIPVILTGEQRVILQFAKGEFCPMKEPHDVMIFYGCLYHDQNWVTIHYRSLIMWHTHCVRDIFCSLESQWKLWVRTFYYLCRSSPNVIWMIKSRIIRCARLENAYSILVGKWEGKGALRRPRF
jgi:hypothetical protein